MVPALNLRVGREAPRCQASSYLATRDAEKGVIFHHVDMAEGTSTTYASYCRCSYPPTVHKVLHHVTDQGLPDGRQVKQSGLYHVVAIIRGLREVSQPILEMYCTCMDVLLIMLCSTLNYH
ncbi:uncharacterized protein DS421_7g218160 [Arachis hypogaea]|nr:uncharacterized protein DS421_7g218160 [Arachis hypogaea]